MFTTPEDFKIVPYAIPDQTGDGVNDTLTPFIEKVEADDLIALLGFLFYNAFIEALPEKYNPETDYAVGAKVLVDTAIYESLQTPNVGQPVTNAAFWVAQPADRWTRLLAGATYLNPDGKKNQWVGMKELCKPMVFAEFLLNFSDYVTAMGVVLAMSENAQRQDGGVRASNAWNNYAKLACGSFDYLSNRNSLYGYLISVKDDFNDIAVDGGYTDFEEYLEENFCNPGNMNVFNL
jgi:hypothetical protein